MRSLVLVIACLLSIYLPAAAQVRFSPDQVTWAFSGCASDTTLEVYLVNYGSDDRSDVLSKTSGMEILEFPAGWGLGPIQTISPGDSIRFLIKHKTPIGSNNDQFYADLEFNSVYFASRATRDYPRLLVDPSVVKLSDVPIRTTLSDTVVITNPGQTYRTIELPEFDSLGWKIIAPDSIILAPGEQVKVRFEYAPRSGGNVTLRYRLDDQCTNTFIWLEGTTRNTNLAWLQDRLIDTIVGCGDPTDHTLKYYHTDSATPLLLDSIAFIGDAGNWTFVSEAPRNIIVEPGDTLSITVRRLQNDRAVKLALFTSQAWGDTLSLSLTAKVPNPQFIFVEDTVTLDLKLGETVEDLFFELKNHGQGQVRFHALEQTGDARWKVDPIDTDLVLGQNDRMKVHTHFTGANEYGVYPMTFTLVADRCDLRLTRTVIARILDPSAVRIAEISGVHVYQISDGSQIGVEAPIGSDILIVDALGRVIRNSRMDAQRIEIEGLCSGAYVVSVRQASGTFAKLVRIAR